MDADNLKEIIFKRTGIQPNELVYPREKSAWTPCVVRDGNLAMAEESTCVGCGVSVMYLLDKEQERIENES